jgi:hypothetical protein
MFGVPCTPAHQPAITPSAAAAPKLVAFCDRHAFFRANEIELWIKLLTTLSSGVGSRQSSGGNKYASKSTRPKGEQEIFHQPYAGSKISSPTDLQFLTNGYLTQII